MASTAIKPFQNRLLTHRQELSIPGESNRLRGMLQAGFSIRIDVSLHHRECKAITNSRVGK